MKKQILVATGEPGRVKRLLSVLGEWLQINIVIKDLSGDSQNAAQVVLRRTPDDAQRAFEVPAEKLVFFNGESDPTQENLVIFSDSPHLDSRLRRQQLCQCVRGVLPANCEGEILASAGRSRLWTSSGPKGHRTEFAMEALPALQPREFLIDYLHSSQWTGVLPLIAFLRRITQDQAWVSPPLRACFMFDDPNLHWPTYGFLDYAALAHHAKKHKYHAAIATIPLDAWFVHSSVARLFCENTKHLSLLVHGNNHTRNELAQLHGNGTCQGLVAQSLKRISRFERISGLHVSRVMAAPHSACTADAAAELLRQGFEAVCISHELLRSFNPTTDWPASLGLEPAEFLSNGLPVIPRFHLSKECTTSAILAAFIGQAIITFGHHQDLADGLSLLAQISENINRMGTVEWCDLTRIARTNYKHRVSGSTLQLKMYSRHIEVQVPAEIETVEAHRPWHGPDQAGAQFETRINNDSWTQADGGEIPIPQQRGRARTLEIRSVAVGSVDYRQIPSQSLQAWGVVRRLLTEARDRCYFHGE